jgi:tetratricopeptide (TPR) repeat protein
MTLKHKPLVAAIIAAALCLTAPAGFSQVVGPPPGWELRNGSWVPLVQPGTDTPDALVAQMIKDLDLGRTGKVIDDAKKWIKKNQKHPLMPQVLLIQGDAEVARGNRYTALYSYEELLNNYPTSELFPHVLEREYNIADAFLRGYKRKFLG